MKKIILEFTALLLGPALVSSAFTTESSQTPSSSDYELEKVLVFGQHGLHSLVEKDPQKTAKYSPYAWAKWDMPPGYLTAEGIVLETYFG